MTIPQSFIQDLLARVDVVEVVGRYVQLKKGGANYMGLCPFHGEKSPSFSVSPSKQFYHCFGCGKSGNAIGFLMDHAGMGFVEAVQELANELGLPVPDEGRSPQEKERAAAQREKEATLGDVLEKAATAYAKQLRDAPQAVAYLKQRGVSGAIAKRYGLGYAPAGWRHLASVFPRYDDPLLEESGLVIVNAEDGKRYDRFRDRVMFPIRNVKGQCIAFGGRVLGDEKPKYLNSPETPLFHKGRELYGLFEARTAIREAGYALVTEGYMDVVALAQLGFPQAVATLGTACTSEHIQKLLRFTDQIVFSFDGDNAGRNAARKALVGALPHATDTRSLKFLFLPSEHDPDSFIRTHGQEAFARLVGEAVPLSRFLIEAASEGCDLGTPEGRARMASHARELWTPLPEGVLKQQLLGELAERAQVDRRDLAELWSEPPPITRRADSLHTSLPTVASTQAPPWSGPQGERSMRLGSGFQRANRRPSQGWGVGSAAPRALPVNRTGQAARLLLSHMAFFEFLSHEDQALLGQQAEPYGPLFVWLEEQFHEHGAVSWAVLRESLQGQPFAELAERLMTGPHAQTEGEWHELRLELRDLLNRMHIDAIKAQQNQLIQSADGTPEALAHYRALETQRKALEHALHKIA